MSDCSICNYGFDMKKSKGKTKVKLPKCYECKKTVPNVIAMGYGTIEKKGKKINIVLCCHCCPREGKVVSDKIADALKGVKIHREETLKYIRVSELPENERGPLNEWMCGQTRPWIKRLGMKGQDAVYIHDYLNWKTGGRPWD